MITELQLRHYSLILIHTFVPSALMPIYFVVQNTLNYRLWKFHAHSLLYNKYLSYLLIVPFG